MKTLGSSYHKHVTHFVPSCDGVFFWVLSHRSILYWSVAMYHSCRSSTVYIPVIVMDSSHKGMDPQCICQWPYLSHLVYMDLHFIGWQPCFESNMFWAWECPPQLWYIWSLVFVFAAPLSNSGLTQIYQFSPKVCSHQCTSDLIL